VVVAQLAELGGELEAITVERPDESLVTPDLSPSEHGFDVARARELLGQDFSVDEAVDALERMGHGVAEASEAEIKVRTPAWRSDVLHEVDLIEDVAIGLGYDRFTGTDPTEVTFGNASPTETFQEQVRDVLTGYGYLQCMTLTLRNRDEQTELIGADDELIAVENPVSSEQEVLRRRLLPALIDLAADNTHRDLPQKLFETGDVIVPREEGAPHNEPRVAGLLVAPEAGFTDVKSHVDGLLRSLGMRLNVAEHDAPGFIEGRCAQVVDAESEDVLGVMGEIHPGTLEAVELATPAVGFELSFFGFPDQGTWSPEDEDPRRREGPSV
jgi:phenylalanyl-tRNA synthetase beta chain